MQPGSLRPSSTAAVAEHPGWWTRLTRRSVAGTLRLLRLRESRERVARGFSLGLIINFLPSFGFGVLISGFVARALGGNLAAGIAGGASLTFAWPLLFYFNVKVGSLFARPERAVNDLADVTNETMNALMWGQAFVIGSIINCLVVGLFVYIALLILYPPLRPRAIGGVRRIAAAMRRRGKRSEAA
ncbi:MAG: DUF2062 domain-containing protein [Phycisphaerales bacterium]|nr:DUF2062 domain-containing protein [Phycisphaerales bacterium]